MKVTGYRCELCGKDFVAVEFHAVPQPYKFTANTVIPGEAGCSWDYREICEGCEVEIRKAINSAVSNLKAKPEVTE